ncbi:MAG: hypothetical protein ACWA5W_11075 [Phycisphaerales bacterium]
MTNTPPQPEQQHIDAVLEPVTPGSQYEFVEISSEPIPFDPPWTRIGPFGARFVALLKQGIRSQWKFMVLFVIGLVLIEGIARTVEPRFLHRIYSRTMTGGHPIDMNEQGFRGNPVAMPKPAGTTRILALGDSVTFGSGIAWQGAWPNQLETMLNESSQNTPESGGTESAGYDTINAGLPALDLGQIELEYTTRWSALAPDRAIVMVTGNMVSFAYARRNREAVTVRNPKEREPTPQNPEPGIKDKVKDMYFSLALPGVLTMGMEHLKFAIGLERHDVDPHFPTGVMLAHGYIQNGIGSEQIEEAWSLFGAQLESLVHTIEADGIEVTVIYSPPRFLLSDHRIDNLKWVDKDRLTIDSAERIEAMCTSLNIKFINPLQALRTAPEPIYMLSDYTHFDTNGHHTIAQLVADSIIDQ